MIKEHIKVEEEMLERIGCRQKTNESKIKVKKLIKRRNQWRNVKWGINKEGMEMKISMECKEQKIVQPEKSKKVYE